MAQTVVAYAPRPVVPPEPAAQTPGAAPWSRNDPAMLARRRWILAVCAQLPACDDLAAASGIVGEAVVALTGAIRVSCLFHDAEGGVLWSEGDGEREGPATCGLAGFAACTGRPVLTPRASDDARYWGPIDDPTGRGAEGVIAVPVPSAEGPAQAVLVAVTHPERPPGAASLDALAALAHELSPMLQHLGAKLETRDLLAPRHTAMFNEAAIAEFTESREHGDVVRVTPWWTGGLLWCLLLLAVAAGSLLGFGTVDEHSRGPAVVRHEGRVEVSAAEAGVIHTVLVGPGDAVEEGDLLARLEAREERDAVARLQAEHDQHLRARMRDPEDVGTAQALVAVRSRLDAAQTRLRERDLRAPAAGVVRDVRLRTGQPVVVGEPLLSLAPRGQTPTVVAFLPGGDRPRLAPGMPLRLELRGYPYAYQSLTVTDVSEEVTGPAAAQRFLGAGVADSVPIDGPVVMVRARVDGHTFIADGQAYDLHEGMPGTAEVRVRRAPILFVLFPALERLRGV